MRRSSSRSPDSAAARSLRAAAGGLGEGARGSRDGAARGPAVAALLGAVALLCVPAIARAQACCAAASALGIARLAPHEDAVIGVGARAMSLFASIGPDGKYLGSPANTAEYGFEQDIAATMRVLSHGQITAVVPIVETHRSVPGLTDTGAGIGDVQLGARYDFIETGTSRRWPGIALAWSLTLPTGVAPESASGPLAADATGTGAVQAGAQLALERTFGDTFLHLSGSAVWRSPRVVAGLHTQRGPALGAFAAAGTTFLRGDLVGAVTLGYTAETPVRIEGVLEPESGHEGTRAGLSGGYSFSFDWRVQGALFCDLPFAPLTRNQPVGAGLSLMLLRSGW